MSIAVSRRVVVGVRRWSSYLATIARHANGATRGNLSGQELLLLRGALLAKTAAMLRMDMIGRNEEVPENGGAALADRRCRPPNRRPTP
jgi:hypothetical protein